MSKGRAAGPATGARWEEAAAPKSPAGGAIRGRVAAPRSPRAVTYARTHAHTPRYTCPEKCTHGIAGSYRGPRTYEQGPRCAQKAHARAHQDTHTHAHHAQVSGPPTAR